MNRFRATLAGNSFAIRSVVYGGILVTGTVLWLVYSSVNRRAELSWPTGGAENWTRDIYSVDSPKDLHSAVTIMNISNLNGQLSAFCALKNLDPEHGIAIKLFSDANGLLWCPVTLEASNSRSGPWRRIRTGLDRRATDTKVLRPSEAITFNVDLNDYRLILAEYRYGRITTATGDATTFDFEVLHPTAAYIPPREEFHKEATPDPH